MEKNIEGFSVYSPQFELNVHDMKDTAKKIREDITHKLEGYVKPIDNAFSMRCF